MDTQPLLILIAVLLVAAVALLLVLVLRRPEVRLEQALREEQRVGRGELHQQLARLSASQEQRIDAFGVRLNELTTRTDQRLDVLRDSLTEDAPKARLEGGEQQQRSADRLGQRLNELVERNERGIGEMRATLEKQLQALQADNAQKLEKMRETVDEK